MAAPITSTYSSVFIDQPNPLSFLEILGFDFNEQIRLDCVEFCFIPALLETFENLR